MATELSAEDKYYNFKAYQQIHHSYSYPREIDFEGRQFTCLSKDVFCIEFEVQEIIDNIPPITKPGSRILEMGSGTGCVIISLYLRNKKHVDYVLGLDINPEAVENTKENVRRYAVPGEARISDVFDNVKPDEKFDIIFWNVPSFAITEEEKGDFGSLGYGDFGYKAVDRFIRDARSFLTAEGRVVFLFSPECGDVKKLQAIARKHSKQLKVLWKSRVFETEGNIRGKMTRTIYEVLEA